VIRILALLFLFSSLRITAVPSTNQAVGQAVLQAAGGTWNFGPNGTKPGTIVGLRFEDFRERKNVAFSLQGPEGWNGGAPYSWSEDSMWGPRLLVLRDIAAVAGSYRLTTAAGDERIVVAMSFGLSNLLPKPQVQVRVLDRTARVQVGPIPRAQAYKIGLVDLQSGRNLGGCSGANRDCQTPPLDPGQYRVIVSALTDSCCGIGPIPVGADIRWPSEVHGSEATSDFIVP
jgi:hypothetical protein